MQLDAAHVDAVQCETGCAPSQFTIIDPGHISHVIDRRNLDARGFSRFTVDNVQHICRHCLMTINIARSHNDPYY